MLKTFKTSIARAIAEKLFLKMTAKAKAEFLSNKMAWARECDLKKEIEIRLGL